MENRNLSRNVVSLSSDAAYINQEVEQGDKALVSALRHYRNAGERLAIVRDRYKNKKSKKGDSFLAWVEKYCKFTRKQAYHYISLFEGFSKLDNADDLSLSQALKVLSSSDKSKNQLTDEQLDQQHMQFLQDLEKAKSVKAKSVDWSLIFAVTTINTSNVRDYVAYCAYVEQCNLNAKNTLNERRRIRLKEQEQLIEDIKKVDVEVVLMNQKKKTKRQAPQVIDVSSVEVKAEDNPPKASQPSSNPYAGFSDYELGLVEQLKQGKTVVAAMFNFTNPYTPFLSWARDQGLVVKIDRTSKDWGNPFVVPGDGSVNEVLQSYADYYLPRKFSLLPRIRTELKGKVLACWCKKPNYHIPGKADIQPCHGDILAAIANGDK